MKLGDLLFNLLVVAMAVPTWVWAILFVMAIILIVIALFKLIDLIQACFKRRLDAGLQMALSKED